MDPIRVTAKQQFIKSQRENEQKAVAEQNAKKTETIQIPSGSPDSQKRASPTETPTGTPPQRKRHKRDGSRLDRDIFSRDIGHDLKATSEEALGGIRVGWPKSAKDYPVGYGVASPPGFCSPSCDCMDDARLQTIEELTKKWLEQMDKASGRLQNINNSWKAFEAKEFIWRRGLTTNQPCIMCTSQHPDAGVPQKHSDTPGAKACREFARSVMMAIQEVLNDIPVTEFSGPKRIRIPVEAFIHSSVDYVPVRHEFSDDSITPKWLSIDTSSGDIFPSSDLGESELAEARKGIHAKVVARHMDDSVAGSVKIHISGSQVSRCEKTSMMIARRLLESGMEQSMMDILKSTLSELCDFEARSGHNVSVARWLEVMSQVRRMARTGGSGHVRPPR
jgi:hypothetical protein